MEITVPADASEAEQFFGSLASDFDTTRPLRWGFLLRGLTESQVGPLLAEVSTLGFTQIEPMLDEGHEGRYCLWFAEVRAHSVRSFVERVGVVERLALREGLTLSDFSAGRLQ